MSQLSFPAASSPAPHPLPDGELHHTIASKRGDRLLEGTEVVRRRPATGLLVLDIGRHIGPPYCLEEDRRRGGMEADQDQGIAIWILTGHARILGREHDQGRIRLDRGVVLHHEEVRDIGGVTVPHRREGGGEGGAPAIQAFLATATGVGVGAEVDIEGDEVEKRA